MTETHRIPQLTTSNFDFPGLIQNPKAKYVDKTDLLYTLCNDADQQLFISRPRRFGKSLMLSTLKAMFEGRRELFKGLKLDDLPWECWDEKCRYPVLSFDMSKLAPSEGLSAMQKTLRLMIDEKAEEFGCAAPDTPLLGFAFEDLLRSVAAKSPNGKIIVLVDEYDTPVQGFLDNPSELGKVNAFLHDFYRRLKINSGSIRFLMMTGVTKLTKLSVFSGLNHLKDRTMDPRFATLLGYTPEELDGPLRENVMAFGAMNGWDFPTARAKLLEWYDGYRFSPESEEKVCNPVSLGSALESGDLRNFWEVTGRATMIIDRIKAADEIPADLNGMLVDPMDLDVCDAETMPLAALLYQGGYLTIADVDEEDGSISLGIPNLEISKSLHEGFMRSILGRSMENWSERMILARRDIRAKGVETLLTRNLRAVFAAVPHEWRIEDEREAKRYFLLFMKLIGADISGERQSARGRADAILKDKSGVYVFEFKYGKTAREAVDQARGKDYVGPWLDGNPPVFLVGVNYDPEKRGIDDPIVERA